MGVCVFVCVFRSWLPCWVTDNVKVCHCASCHLGRPTVCQSGNSPHKRGIQLKMSLNNKQVWKEIYCVEFCFFIYSGGAQMNMKLLAARPLKYATDILLQVWFHLMGYVVRVYWLEVSKPDWSCALPLVWFDMQIKRDTRCHIGLYGASSRWMLFYPPYSRARFIAAAAFRDEPITFPIENFESFSSIHMVTT